MQCSANNAPIEALIAERPATNYKLALEAEQQRPEAWRFPAGKAIWVSLLALLVSIFALIRSFIG